MKKEYSDKISELVGVPYVMIDSAKLSAQTRKRLYWTNIPNVTQPNDLGILLKDIIHENEEKPVKITDRNIQHFKTLEQKSLTCTASMYKSAGNNGCTLISETLKKYIVPFDETFVFLEKEVQSGKMGYFRKDSQANRVYYINNKAVTLCGASGGGAAKMGQYFIGDISFDATDDRKIFTLEKNGDKGLLIEGYIRKLTVRECERLQGLPDFYTDCEGVSNSQRYKCLGNGFNAPIISHILSFMK
jgi:DNA (cytosine-5)-methyltransferase 3A